MSRKSLIESDSIRAAERGHGGSRRCETLGTYHNVSKKYLPLYLAEFQYRFNNRDNKNIFFDVIAGC
ncbi:transposase [Candidatus Binatus sp.]|uniref:transposase n=1 Tax=Candidatus Binatus sp. TaxID=2811406 RepID=UPI003CC50E6E